ncbi:MAG: NAD(P)-dependent oxidoreductase [Lewinellaceae bacterium]|nr:NAD(P)-dependent oxidoreductase [Lewinellaceae bacterium]HQU55046.1 NAD(P)-dependent oxidoreductase [Saprospiraceae bacterium]
MTFKDKTAFITGASRGIGKAIALKLASLGANIVIAAKTTEPHPKLEGTIYTAAEDIRAAGGQALAVKVDVREEAEVQAAVDQAVEQFGGIDIVINNASAIQLTPSEHTEMKRFDLMHQINYRGTFLVSKTCLPHLKKRANPHILTLSPPLDLNPAFFAPHVAYTISKFSMSLCMLGLAGEYAEYGIACNTLWPETTIATAAVLNLLGGESMMQVSRKPEIVADAAAWILQQPAKNYTGRFLIDTEVLQEAGVSDFSGYAVVPGSTTLMPDLFTPGYLKVMIGGE